MNKVNKETMGIEVSQNEGYNSYNTQVKFAPKGGKSSNYKHQIMVNRYPTNNCQVSTLGQVCNITTISSGATKRLDCIMAEFKKLTQRQILLDVTQRVYPEVMKRFKNYTTVVHTFKYISSNRTPMQMMLLRWNS